MERFVPEGSCDPGDLDRLAEMMAKGKTAVLTGAGCSTASGIPDYRGPQTGQKKRSPILYQEFVRNPEARRRYWARSTVGWPHLRAARPNAGHLALAKLEGQGALTGLITQNVDGLHGEAGSKSLVELHGRLAWNRCLSCGKRTCRDATQEWLLTQNPGWGESCRNLEMAPDGDMEIPEVPADFRIPDCLDCGGIVKPDVVFFGENVAREVVDAAWRCLEESKLLLVVGSSLTVYSGFRFVVGAKKWGIPVAVVNIGPTRADPVVDLKLEGQCSEVLTELLERVSVR